ncbi:hypothetical protein GCM10027404_31130 [Arthrobacter tumbae]
MPVGATRLGLCDDVKGASCNQLEIHCHERFQARSEFAAGSPDSLCNSAYLTVFPGQEHDNAVGFTEFVRAKDDAFRRVGSRRE